MKVLWLINNLIPEIAEQIGCEKTPFGGWVIGMLHALTDNSEVLNDILELVLICPAMDEKEGFTKNYSYYTFRNKTKTANYYQIRLFGSIIEKEKPDIIQIFGSEYTHANSMVKAAEEKGYQDRTILHIQGLTSVIAKHMYGSLSNRAIYSFSVRDIIKQDNVYFAQKKMIKRGRIERDTIMRVAGVLGRTEWDKACTSYISSDIEYFTCNEVLRDSFYKGKWKFEKCQLHTIFFSQPMGLVKGFYQLLKAFPIILSFYPDARIRTTGNPLDYSIFGYFRQSAFQNEMKRIITRYGFEDRIDFLGVLDEKAMVEELERTHVFVLSSSIENSPNSLGEAMLVGTPCVVSDVGGVSSMISHAEEGFLYPFDEEYMLAWYIMRLFENPELCRKFSDNCIFRAKELFSKEEAVLSLSKAYKTIMNKQRKQ